MAKNGPRGLIRGAKPPWGPYGTSFRRRWEGVVVRPRFFRHRFFVLEGLLLPCLGPSPDGGHLAWRRARPLGRRIGERAAGLPRTKSRHAKLKNLRVAQMAATLYAESALFTREATRAGRARALKGLRDCYEELLPTIRPTNTTASSFIFVWKLVDTWAPWGRYAGTRKKLRVLQGRNRMRLRPSFLYRVCSA